jgi:hypothetical protein
MLAAYLGMNNWFEATDGVDYYSVMTVEPILPNLVQHTAGLLIAVDVCNGVHSHSGRYAAFIGEEKRLREFSG